MSHRHEIVQPDKGDSIGAKGNAAAAASDALTVEALELERDRLSSARNMEGQLKGYSATPSCFLSDASKHEATPKNDVVRTYRYKDGTTITDHANGDSVKKSPEGSTVTTRKDGTMIFQDRDGKVNMVVAKDGTTTQIDYKKGTTTTEYPDGTVLIEERNGRKTRLNRGYLRQSKAR